MIKPSTIRIVFTLDISRGWEIQQIDINNAFLNGEHQEEVYMAQHEGFMIQLSLHMYVNYERPYMA